MHYGDWNDNGNGWWWIPMVLMMITFWGALAWVVVTLIRNISRPAETPRPTLPPQAGPPAADPRQILGERLARGEMDIDDYHARLDALDHSRPQTGAAPGG